MDLDQMGLGLKVYCSVSR